MPPTIILVILIGLIGGVAVGVQGPLSSMLTHRLGVMESIFIVHVGGAIVIAVPLILRGGGNLGAWRTAPWYALIAGWFGLVIIAAVSYSIPRIGVAGTVTLVVAGQLVVSVALDHFGWLGVDVRRVDLQRLIGIAVLLVGVLLIVRK